MRNTRSGPKNGCQREAAVALLSQLPSGTHRFPHDLDPEQDETDRRSDDDDGHRREVGHLFERVLRDRRAQDPDDEHGQRHRYRETPVHTLRVAFLSCPRASSTTRLATTTCSSFSGTGSRSLPTTSESASWPPRSSWR